MRILPETPVRVAMPSTRIPAAVLTWLAAIAACGVGLVPAAAQHPGDPQRYAVFDALFVQRNTGAVDRPLIARGASTQPALSGWDPTSQVGYGARVFYGDLGSMNPGWEIGYLGVFGMTTDTLLTDPADSLRAAGTLGISPAAGLNNAATATYTGQASLNSLEANAVFHEFDGGFDKGSPYPWQRRNDYDGGGVDWLAGVRWANLEDSATLGFLQAGATAPNTYTVNATSNLFAAQTGLRGRLGWRDWAVDGFMKVGVAGTLLSQSQTMQNLVPTPPFSFRSPRSGDHVGMGMIAEINLGGIYRITDVWGLRFGYDLLWLTGVALAEDQFDLSANVDPQAGTAIGTVGSVFFQGAHLGLEARW